MLYRYPTYEERTVLCISTMCGCPMGCRFCGTGDYFVRSLTAEEIMDIKRAIVEDVFGEFRPLIIEMRNALYDADTTRLRKLIAELENQMFVEGM